MEINKKSFKQTEIIKRIVTAGFKTDAALEEGAVDKIIAATATCRVKSVTAGEAGAEASIRARITVLYLMPEGETDRYESGVDFSVLIPFDGAYKGEPLVDVTVDEVRVSSQPGGFGVTATVTAEAKFAVEKEFFYIEDADGLVVKKAEFSALNEICRKCDAFEVEEEKTYNYVIKKILYSCETARIISAQCGVDSVICDCEVAGELLILTADGEEIRENTAFTFRIEQECEGVSPDLLCYGDVRVCGANFRVETVDDSANSTVTFGYSLKFYTVVYSQEQLECVDDCFSLTNQIKTEAEEYAVVSSAEQKTFKSKAFGEAVCAKDGEIKKVLGSCIDGLNYSVGGEKLVVSGVLKTEIVALNQNGEYAKTCCELPFSLEFSPVCAVADLECFVRGVTVKEFDGKVMAEGEITVIVLDEKPCARKFITAIEEGEAKPLDDGAVSLIFVKKGETAWDVCKKAGVSERELLSQSGETEFPASKDYSIAVYRRIDI